MIKSILESTGLPVAHYQFKKKQAPPYLVYLIQGNENFGADNIVYHSQIDYDIELYTNDKDPINEAKVELALTTNDIYFEKDETWIQSEEMYQVIYSIRR